MSCSRIISAPIQWFQRVCCCCKPRSEKEERTNAAGMREFKRRNPEDLKARHVTPFPGELQKLTAQLNKKED